MPPKYLIDVNLPRFFSIWNSDLYIHQYDLGDSWSDTEIWAYAKENDLTIITKDSDFSTRIMMHTPPPRVIHVRVGNMKMKQFYDTLSGLWPSVVSLNEGYKLINVFPDRIEGIM